MHSIVISGRTYPPSLSGLRSCSTAYCVEHGKVCRTVECTVQCGETQRGRHISGSQNKKFRSKYLGEAKVDDTSMEPKSTWSSNWNHSAARDHAVPDRVSHNPEQPQAWQLIT